jgi:hypothetical protein
MIRLLAVACAASLIAACADEGAPEASRQETIVDGEVTSGLDAVVAVAPQRIGCDEPRTILCSGTLVAPDAVLSAAHCFSSRRPGLAYEVVVGDAIDDDDAFAVVEVATHPDFDAETRANDVAILWLERPVPGVTPEALPAVDAPDLAIDAPVDLAGFGATAAGAPPDGLKRVGVGVVGEVDAGAVRVDPDPSVSCVGDSGGPLFTSSGQLVGVASSGDTGCRETSVYTLVAPTMATFIEPTLSMGPMERPADHDSCGQACASDHECAVGFVCLPAPEGTTFRCALPGQEAGELTDACTNDAICTSGLCASNALGGCQCYEPCVAPAPESSSGCSLRRGANATSPAWWVALALLVVRSRRTARPPAGRQSPFRSRHQRG